MILFQEENYIPIQAEAGKGSLNFALLYDKNHKEEFEKEAEKFDLDLPSADTFTSYLIKKSILYENKTTDKMPDNAVILGFGASKSQNAMYVYFESAHNLKFQPLR